MASLQDLRSTALRAPGNMCFVSGLVAAATTAGLYKTVTNTIVYTFDGTFKTYAPTDNIAYAAPTAAQLPGEFERWAPYSISATDVARTFYLVGAFDSAGTVTTFQGTYAGQDLSRRGANMGKGDGLIPQIPDGFVPFVVIKVANPASLAFVPGTTALTTASSRVVTIANVSVLPAATTL
jgi:hypothetical protein